MLKTTLQSSFANQGQICLCGSRIYVEEKIYDRFKQDFVEQTERLVVGDPREPASNLGAIVSQQHFDKIQNCIELARSEGGTVLCGGRAAPVGNRCENG